jgi:hypothetical protein
LLDFSSTVLKEGMVFLSGQDVNFSMALPVPDSDLDAHPEIQPQALSASE